jgi:Tfp pilus assembly protein PilW
MLRRLRAKLRGGDQSGISLVEMMIALVLFSLVVVAVDSSLTVVQERQVQVTNGVEALDTLQAAEEVITRDISAATSWTTPAVPTSTPGSAITAQSLVFQASLTNTAGAPTTNLVTIALNTTTHQLQVCTNLTLTTSGCGSSVAGVHLQAQVANIDTSSLFTFTTHQVTQTINSVTTNTYFFTSVASTLTLDSPSVGAPRMSQTTLQTPEIVTYNIVYACQTASAAEGASGTC